MQLLRLPIVLCTETHNAFASFKRWGMYGMPRRYFLEKVMENIGKSIAFATSLFPEFHVAVNMEDLLDALTNTVSAYDPFNQVHQCELTRQSTACPLVSNGALKLHI